MTNNDVVLLANAVSLSLKSKAGFVHILNEVSLEVKAGQSIGIVGRSGSGKSSLLSLLAGLEKPTGGKILAGDIGGPNEVDIASKNEDELAAFRRENIGFVFQAFHLIPTMTALENAALPLELIGDPKAFEKAAGYLQTVGLGERTDHYPDQLSGGEQQRVAIVRAVIGNPPILLADEPTGNLDQASGAFVADMLFNLQGEAGAALVMVTHDRELAARCDCIAEMVDGKLTVQTTAKSVSGKTVSAKAVSGS